MTLASTALVPELQYFFNYFVKHSSVNLNGVPFPSPIGEIYMGQNSFIEMLFNDSYEEIEYQHLYYEDTSRGSWPGVVKSRLLVYPMSAKYFQIAPNDTTGSNIFTLVDDDLTLLDTLLQYRIDSTSVTIIDSTSNTFVSDVLYANYDSLSSNLSKLIFLYLDLQIYENTDNFNNRVLVSSAESTLENMYETYVLDMFFNIISARGI